MKAIPSAGTRVLALALGFVLAQAAGATPLRITVIGDSLSAEYDALPNIPGVEDPTAYAAVTVPDWESRCWVEVLGLLRTNAVDFGSQKTVLPGWDDLRFTGYKYNFAIPGFEAAQYEDIVNSTLFRNPQYYPYRLTLAEALRSQTDACVVWIGANEFRANYGALYAGEDPAPLLEDLRHDIAEILDFVRNQSATSKLVVVNLPDLGATPTKQAAHPDPVKRERVSDATRLANQAISELAAARGLPVADAFAATRRLIEGQTNWFGPVDIRAGSDPDNNPRYAFARDGLHPNTGLQIEIARIILATFNAHYGTSLPSITDGEALALLGIAPEQPYLDWAAAQVPPVGGMGEDPDRDGLSNLVEFVFSLNPNVPNASPLTITSLSSGVEVSYQLSPDRLRLASVTPQWSTDLAGWVDVPDTNLTTAAGGQVTIRLPAAETERFVRLRVAVWVAL